MTDSTKSGASSSTAVPLVVKRYVTSEISRALADFRKSVFSQIDDVVAHALNGVNLDQPNVTDALRTEVRTDVDTALGTFMSEATLKVEEVVANQMAATNQQHRDRIASAKVEILTELKSHLTGLVETTVSPLREKQIELEAKVMAFQNIEEKSRQENTYGARNPTSIPPVYLEGFTQAAGTNASPPDNVAGFIGQSRTTAAPRQPLEVVPKFEPLERAGEKPRRASKSGLKKSTASSDDSSSDDSRHRRSRRRRGRGKRRSKQTDSNSETDLSSSSGSDSDESVKISSKRKLGPRKTGLSAWRPTDQLFRKVCNYRTYRLEDTDSSINRKVSRNTRKRVKELEVTMQDSKFDGSDPVTVVKFLSRLKRDCDRNDISEAAAFLALPYMLKGEAHDDFEAVVDGEKSRDNVRDWSTAVDWLLRTYMTNENIKKALNSFRTTKQGPFETENDYATRVMTAAKRCGNVHTSHQVNTQFIEGLLPVIVPLVDAAYEQEPGMTFLQLVRLARSKGDSYRAGLDNGQTREASKIAPKRMGRPIVNFVSDNSGTTGSSSARTRNDASSGELNLVNSLEENESLSVPSCPTTTTYTVEDADPAMFMDRRPNLPTRGIIRSGPPSFICHECYKKGHLKPNCPLPARELARVPYNYSQLSEQERRGVPDAAYLRALAVLHYQANLGVKPKTPPHTEQVPGAAPQADSKK